MNYEFGEEMPMLAETIRVKGFDGVDVPTYLARPLGSRPFGAIVLLHSSAGWTVSAKELVRRFACFGYIALLPDLDHYGAPGLPPTEAANLVKDAGGVADDQFLADVGGVRDYLRTIPEWNGRLGSIGFCAGGRQSFLLGCKNLVTAAIVCYGGGIVHAPTAPERLSRQPVPPIDLVADLTCPVLGLFGELDDKPSPSEVAEISRALTAAGKEHDFTIYENTGHAYFDVTRDEYRPRSVSNSWARIFPFLEQHVAGG